MGLSKDENNLHPILIILFGLAFITLFGNYWSLFYRINYEFNCVLLLLAFLYTLTNFSELVKFLRPSINALKSRPSIALFLGALFFIIALFQSSGAVTNSDEGGYYLPLVKWIEGYPVVPGMALFNARIGFNSAFHMTNSIFGQAWWFNAEGGLYDVNALLFVLINWWFLSGMSKPTVKRCAYDLIGVLKIGAMVIPFSFLNNSMDSDYPSIFIGLVVIIIWLQQRKQTKLGEINYELLVIGVLSLYLFTIKPFAVFYFLFPLLAILNLRPDQKRHLFFFGLVFFSIYLFPWFLRNFYITGYIIFPVYYLDLFSPEWKLPLEVIKSSYDIVEEFAKIEIVRPGYLYEGLRQWSFSEWFPVWKSIQHKTMLGLIVYYLLPFSVLVFLLNISFLRKKKEYRLFFLTQIISLIIICFWFVKFPSIRFAWAWIYMFMSLSFSILLLLVLRVSMKLLVIPLFFLVTLSSLRSLSLEIKERESINWISPEKVKVVEGLKEKHLGKHIIRVAPSVYCHGTKPPCIPSNNFYEIKMRGENIQQGFMLTN